MKGIILIAIVSIIHGGMQKQSNIEERNLCTFHRYWKELVNEGDFSKHHELVSPDFMAYFPEDPPEFEAKGVDLIKKAKQRRDRMFSKLELIEDEVIAKGNTVVVRFHAVAMHDKMSVLGLEPTGQEVTWQGIGFYRFNEKGLISEARLLTNRTEVIRELTEQAANKIDLGERNLATFHRYWKELVNKEDFSKHHEIIASDFTIYVAGVPLEPRGVAIFIDAKELNDKAYSKIEIIEDDIIVKGNRIATQWHAVAIHDKGSIRGFEVVPDNKEIVWHGTGFYRFNDDGLITEARLLNNFNEVMKARTERAVKIKVQH